MIFLEARAEVKELQNLQEAKHPSHVMERPQGAKVKIQKLLEVTGREEAGRHQKEIPSQEQDQEEIEMTMGEVEEIEAQEKHLIHLFIEALKA